MATDRARRDQSRSSGAPRLAVAVFLLSSQIESTRSPPGDPPERQPLTSSLRARSRPPFLPRRFCKLNNDERFANCEAPQEIGNDEIDILLAAQEARQEALEVDKFGRPQGSDAKASKNIWHRIHRNIFTHREPKSVTEDDVLICACVPDPETGKGCGPDCINRDVLVECDPAFCPCGDGCQNQKFQKKDYAKLDVQRTGRKGHGLFTKQALRKGQFIIEYIGEVLHEDEYRSRKARYDEDGRRHYYFMTLSSSETIDAAERGNAGRFLNHSCDPNCETQKWMVNGELCIGIYALTDIDAGDELTFDYNFERYGDNPIKCFCGTSRCGGWIGAPKDEDGGANDDSDDDIDAFDPDLDPDPVMLEADEAAIEKEEEEGREAKARARMRARRGSGDDMSRWKPKDVYGNDDDDYDGDGEIAKRRREKDREEARARKSSGGGGGGRRSGGGSGVRRSGSSAGLKRVGSNQSGGLLPSNYGSYAHGARRSEVDVKMERLRGKSGALRNSRCGKECIHLFNLAYFVTKEGVPTVSQRDLGLLLEAVALTTNPKTQADLVEYGLLQAFQVCVHKLGGADAGPDYVPILRKIIKIIDNIMTNSPKLVKDGVVKARTARGTLAQALADLRRSPDGALRNLSGGFCAKLDQDAVASTGGYGRPAGGPGGLGFSGPGATPGRASPAFGAPGSAGGPLPPYASGRGYYGASPAGSTAAGGISTPSRPPLAPTAPASTPGNIRPGDWHCPKGCGVVFASKPACFRCGTAKPADAEYATPQTHRSGGRGDGFLGGSVASGGSVGPGSGSKWNDRPPPAFGSSGKPACHECGEVGHMKRDCPRLAGARERIQCHKCGGFGHYARDCPTAYGRGGGGPGLNASANSGVGGPGASLSSIAGKRDRWDDAPGAKRARVDEPRGGWGGVVRDRDPAPPRGAPPGAGSAGAPPGMGVGGMSAPPGMGVGGMSAPRSVAVPKQQPAPARAPSVASQWNTPLSENFMDDVSKMMAWAMVSYRTESHPLYIPGANYDRLVAKLANSIVEKERAQWHERQMPISSVALEKRLGQYVESQVKHMHAQHRSMQSQNGR